jgi:hypothetical protein
MIEAAVFVGAFVWLLLQFRPKRAERWTARQKRLADFLRPWFKHVRADARAVRNNWTAWRWSRKL